LPVGAVTRRPLAWLGLGLLLACTTSYVQVERFPVEQPPIVHKLAIVPFGAGAPVSEPEVPESAPRFVTAKVLEALATDDRFVVIPPEESARALELGGGGDAAARSRTLHTAFGIDAVVTGRVERFIDREGGEKGARRPASVRIQLGMHDASGLPLFRGIYDETQKSVSQSPASFQLARARSFRWLTAEQLASYGARELVAELTDTVR
jgi:hypothetical protein